MALIQSPDLEWLRRFRTLTGQTGVFGVWADGGLDGWVGKDGALVREALGSARTRVLEGVPHAFCLSESGVFDEL
jgi:hypothetical protein